MSEETKANEIERKLQELRDVGAITPEHKAETFRMNAVVELDAILALCAAQVKQPQTVILGFASWPDGSFELIVKDNEWNKETTLCGKLKDGQFEEVSGILPTCVFINATPQPKEVSASRGNDVAVGPSVNEEAGLAPCPHCKSKATLEHGFASRDTTMGCDLFYGQVVCDSEILCGARLHVILNDEQAAIRNATQQWNKRVPSLESTSNDSPKDSRASAEGEQPAQPAVPNIDTQRLDWLEANGHLEHLYEEGRPLYTQPVIRVPKFGFDFDVMTVREAIDKAMGVPSPKPSGDSQPLAGVIQETSTVELERVARTIVEAEQWHYNKAGDKTVSILDRAGRFTDVTRESEAIVLCQNHQAGVKRAVLSALKQVQPKQGDLCHPLSRRREINAKRRREIR